MSYPESLQTRRINTHGQICWRSTLLLERDPTRSNRRIGAQRRRSLDSYFGSALLAELDYLEGGGDSYPNERIVLRIGSDQTVTYLPVRPAGSLGVDSKLMLRSSIGLGCDARLGRHQ